MTVATKPLDGSSPKLSTEKITDGAITCLRLAGTMDEGFDGKRLGASLSGATLLIDLGGVLKISSFGLREWTEFIRAVERHFDQVYLVNCSAKTVDQINMVAGFLGKSRVYSFFAPYRCDYCDHDSTELLRVDSDRQEIVSLRPRETACSLCGRNMYFDEDPAGYFAFAIKQPPVSLAGEVVGFLSSRLGYDVLASDRHLSIDKHVDGRFTYIRLQGALDGSFPSSKIADGLEGVVVVDVSGIGAVDLAGAAEWRNFTKVAQKSCEDLFLYDVPPVMLDKQGRPDEIVKIVSISLPYACSNCSTTTSEIVSVDQHFDVLKFSTPPEIKCSNCKAPTVCVAQETLLSRLRTLPKPNVTSALRSFIKTSKHEKLAREKIAVPAPQTGSRSANWVVAAGLATVAVGAAFLIVNYQQNKEIKQTLAESPAMNGTAQNRDPNLLPRPAWVVSAVPGSSYCVDAVNKLSCVGISPYVRLASYPDKSRDEVLNAVALPAAREAALDELVNTLAIRIEGANFEENVRPLYANARRELLLEYDQVRGDSNSDAYADIVARVRDARSRAASALTASGGPAVPTTSEPFWEEYEAPEGSKAEGTEVLGFVRFEIYVDELRALAKTFSTTTEFDGSTVMTAFPGLAWSHPEFRGGIQVVEAKGALRNEGVKKHEIVMEIDGKPVVTAADLKAFRNIDNVRVAKRIESTPEEGTSAE